MQGLIVNGGALDGRNTIDGIDLYGGDAPGHQLDGIAPEATGIGEQACRGYQPFETEQLYNGAVGQKQYLMADFPVEDVVGKALCVAYKRFIY